MGCFLFVAVVVAVAVAVVARCFFISLFVFMQFLKQFLLQHGGANDHRGWFYFPLSFHRGVICAWRQAARSNDNVFFRRTH